jgi:hypothetical protein
MNGKTRISGSMRIRRIRVGLSFEKLHEREREESGVVMRVTMAKGVRF